MFNKKLKLRILELESKLAESEAKLKNQAIVHLEEIKWLKWQIANPQKYKRGDKIGDILVVSCELKKPSLMNSVSVTLGMLFVSFLCHRDSEYINSLKETYAKNTEAHYEYEMINTISGNMSKLKEFELTNLRKNPPVASKS